MQPVRRGDVGPAVAEIRSIVRSLGFLTQPDPPDGPAVFDSSLEHAVRAFQQHRGLLVDGVVGAGSYRALRDARWKLGDRMLTYLVSSPMTGDDVLTLQERLLELGYDAGRPDAVFGPQTELALRGFQRDYCARCASWRRRYAAGARCSCASRSGCATPARGCAASGSSSTRVTGWASAAPRSAGCARPS
jgi:N-acetyl-anhydromuramyl-L-alanine amidase AmpD